MIKFILVIYFSGIEFYRNKMILPIVMKLSIIIPVYNGEKTIERCLRSIFSQSVDKSEYEVIVVDDCSTDDTVKVIDSLRITPPIMTNMIRAAKLAIL